MKKSGYLSSIGLIILSMLVILCCGCGQKGEIGSAVVEGKTELQEIDLSTEKWKSFREINTEEEWEIVKNYEKQTNSFEEVQIRGGALYAAYQDDVYSLLEYQQVEGENILYAFLLERQNMISMDETMLPVCFGQMENQSELSDAALNEIDNLIKTGNARIVFMDALDQGALGLTIYCYYQEQNRLYDIVITPQGRILQGRSLTENIWPNGERFGRDVCVLREGEDTLYVMDNSGGVLYVLDGKGDITSRIDFPENTMVYFAGRTISKKCIFYTFRGGNCQFFKVENGESAMLSDELRLECGGCWTDWTGKVYYTSPEGLFEWNVQTGDCCKINRLYGLTYLDCKEVMRNSQGRFFVIFDDRVASFCYEMSDEPQPDKVEIKILSWSHDEYINNCAADYMRRHPDVRIVVEQLEDLTGYAMNRLAEEMKKGEGPDLLILRRPEMKILQASGCLQKVDSVLPAEVKENLFQGVMEYGEVDGEQFGLTIEATLNTLLISQDVWQQKSWTLQEVMELFWEKKTGPEELEYVISSIYPCYPEDLLIYLLLFDIDDSKFIDTKQGTCNFQCREFREFLMFCKEFGEDSGRQYDLEDEEKIARVQDGRALTDYFEGSFLKYSYERSLLGEEYHSVSFPCGWSRISSYNCIVESAFTGKRDVCEDFMASLFDEKYQVQYTTGWVRKDILRKRVREHTGFCDNPIFLMDGYNLMELRGKADGSSYLEEYIELMDTGKPQLELGPVANIILEEVGAYFTGDKSVEAVSELIQRRVQLYLNEMN